MQNIPLVHVVVLFNFQTPHQPGQPFKFTVAESCDRIKEEFSFLQAQYHRYIKFHFKQISHYLYTHNDTE